MRRVTVDQQLAHRKAVLVVARVEALEGSFDGLSARVKAAMRTWLHEGRNSMRESGASELRDAEARDSSAERGA